MLEQKQGKLKVTHRVSGENPRADTFITIDDVFVSGVQEITFTNSVEGNPELTLRIRDFGIDIEVDALFVKKEGQ